MLFHKTPNRTKFCGDWLKNAGDIRYRAFVLPKEVGQSSPKSFWGCYPLRSPIMPNFIKIGQTSLGLVGKKFPHTDRHTHTWQPDWLSHASQHARGATKKTIASNLEAAGDGNPAYLSEVTCNVLAGTIQSSIALLNS